MTSGLETEWDYSGRKGRDGQKKKIGKANERKRKVKGGKKWGGKWTRGKRGAPAPHGAIYQGYNRVNAHLHNLHIQTILAYNRLNAHYIAYLSKLAQSWT